MSKELQRLVQEIIDIGKQRGLTQKEMGERTIGETALSRLKKADDARYSTLSELGHLVGMKLIWVDDQSDLASLVNQGELF